MYVRVVYIIVSRFYSYRAILPSRNRLFRSGFLKNLTFFNPLRKIFRNFFDATQSNVSKGFVTMAFQARARRLFIVHYANRAGLSQPLDNVTAKLRKWMPACREMCALRSASEYANEYKSHVEFNALLKYYQFKLYSTCIIYLPGRVYT